STPPTARRLPYLPLFPTRRSSDLFRRSGSPEIGARSAQTCCSRAGLYSTTSLAEPRGGRASLSTTEPSGSSASSKSLDGCGCVTSSATPCSCIAPGDGRERTGAQQPDLRFDRGAHQGAACQTLPARPMKPQWQTRHPLDRLLAEASAPSGP